MYSKTQAIVAMQPSLTIKYVLYRKNDLDKAVRVYQKVPAVSCEIWVVKRLTEI